MGPAVGASACRALRSGGDGHARLWFDPCSAPGLQDRLKTRLVPELGKPRILGQPPQGGIGLLGSALQFRQSGFALAQGEQNPRGVHPRDGASRPQGLQFGERPLRGVALPGLGQRAAQTEPEAGILRFQRDGGTELVERFAVPLEEQIRPFLLVSPEATLVKGNGVASDRRAFR